MSSAHSHARSSSADRLLDRIDQRRIAVAAKLDPDRRKDLGQFMTPAPVAAFMASMIKSSRRPIRLLDPGAGIGSLAVAVIDELCTRRRRPPLIELTAVEVDPTLREALQHSLEEAKRRCAAASIELRADVIQADFIEYGCRALETQLTFDAVNLARFDLIILNPPYRKIGTSSDERRQLEKLNIDATNLYSAFLAVSSKLLARRGQLVAITPRSFCNGRYFQNFRKQFLSEIAFSRIHVIESRTEAFLSDRVLQENIIFHASRQTARSRVVITSGGVSPDSYRFGRAVEYEQLVSAADPELFIHLPHDPKADDVTRFVRTLPCELPDLGLSVSTGRVVDFRSRDYLRADPEPDTAPLIYPTHLRDGLLSWPKAGKKPNAIAVTPETAGLLVPAGNYVLVKRFSAKEEKRRVVAAVCRPEDLPSADTFAFENHVNYFHANGTGIDRDLAFGLAAFLNSRVLDDYFRLFSGHTQVNAGDLRKLQYPSCRMLRDLGRRVADGFPTDTCLDELLGAMVRRGD